jgi:hypothetical protein
VILWWVGAKKTADIFFGKNMRPCALNRRERKLTLITTETRIVEMDPPVYTPAVKAYKNQKFMSHEASRSIRILCEYEVSGTIDDSVSSRK